MNRSSHGENIVPQIEDKYKRIINICFGIDGEGFDDFDVKDIEEIFQDRTLSEGELIKMFKDCLFRVDILNYRIYKQCILL